MTTKRKNSKQGVKPGRSESSSALKGDNEATPDRKNTFLEHFADTGNFSEAARKAGLNRTTLYRTIKNDPKFRESFEEAETVAGWSLKDEARRRAIDGVDEPVFHRGVVVGHIKKYSDSLLSALLSARFPDEFRNRQSIDMNAKVKKAGLDLSKMTEEELLAYARARDDETEEPTV